MSFFDRLGTDRYRQRRVQSFIDNTPSQTITTEPQPSQALNKEANNVSEMQKLIEQSIHPFTQSIHQLTRKVDTLQSQLQKEQQLNEHYQKEIITKQAEFKQIESAIRSRFEQERAFSMSLATEIRSLRQELAGRLQHQDLQSFHLVDSTRSLHEKFKTLDSLGDALSNKITILEKDTLLAQERLHMLHTQQEKQVDAIHSNFSTMLQIAQEKERTERAQFYSNIVLKTQETQDTLQEKLNSRIDSIRDQVNSVVASHNEAMQNQIEMSIQQIRSHVSACLESLENKMDERGQSLRNQVQIEQQNMLQAISVMSDSLYLLYQKNKMYVEGTRSELARQREQLAVECQDKVLKTLAQLKKPLYLER